MPEVIVIHPAEAESFHEVEHLGTEMLSLLDIHVDHDVRVSPFVMDTISPLRLREVKVWTPVSDTRVCTQNGRREVVWHNVSRTGN